VSSLEPNPDAELARRIAAGDEAAFDRLYGENVGRVYAVCLRMAGDAVRARSLTQEAFVRAWQRMGSFRGDSRLSSWLHRIAVNVVLESERSRRRWHGLLLEPEQGSARAMTGASDPVLRVDLERAIARLPDGARRMLVLRDVEGHSYEEVAELTGVSLGTVKSQISRARRLMREMLEA
jgi:RNA polymerase sigma factor (sigma-70 family)